MIVHGYAKDYKYTGDGTLNIRVRIPNIHGPYNLSEYKGVTPRNYTRDENLPYYPSILLPYLPNDGDVVVLMSTNESATQWIIIGLTGGSYRVNNVKEGLDG